MDKGLLTVLFDTIDFSKPNSEDNFYIIYTFTEEPDPYPVGEHLTVTKKKCTCECHTNKKITHMFPCCSSDGYIWEVSTSYDRAIQERKDKELANKWRYGNSLGIPIDPI